MNKIGGYLLALLVLCGIALALYNSAPRSSGTAVKPAVEAHVATTTIKEDTAKYTIDIAYPKFGIPSIDSQIDAMIATTSAQLMAEANADDSGQSAKYELISQFDSVYTGSDIVSARLVVSEYTGGAHPNTNVWGLNYDAKTGAALSLSDALALTGLTLQQVAASSKQQLAKSLGGEFIFPEGADASIDDYSAFVVSKDAVTFYFQPYQVAAYAAGISQTTFPRVK